MSKRQEFLHKNSIAINAVEIIGVAKATRQLTSSGRRSKSKPLPQIPEGCIFLAIMVTLWLIVACSFFSDNVFLCPFYFCFYFLWIFYLQFKSGRITMELVWQWLLISFQKISKYKGQIYPHNFYFKVKYISILSFLIIINHKLYWIIKIQI